MRTALLRVIMQRAAQFSWFSFNKFCFPNRRLHRKYSLHTTEFSLIVLRFNFVPFYILSFLD